MTKRNFEQSICWILILFWVQNDDFTSKLPSGNKDNLVLAYLFNDNLTSKLPSSNKDNLLLAFINIDISAQCLSGYLNFAKIVGHTFTILKWSAFSSRVKVKVNLSKLFRKTSSWKNLIGLNWQLISFSEVRGFSFEGNKRSLFVFCFCFYFKYRKILMILNIRSSMTML